ncbi:DUF2092 domain-containing protein [Algoriphagus namhaensis]|uniref:DUF2092 domain-containing protein n=1 Tax=Algoriphagus namhaensis TaxID=915353 RepID=A0ABV8AQY5_9BACT
MIKRMSFGLFLLFWTVTAQAQEIKLDTTALTILDNMSEMFGQLKSIGFKSNIARDVSFSNDVNIKQFSSTEVKIQGPNKFVTRVHGEEKEEVYKYNGEQVYYFSFTNNLFAVSDAPDNLIETIDWLYTDFGIEFTAADIFYPNFSKDLADNMNFIQFIGVVHIDGERSFHILAQNESISVQFWIKDDVYLLPSKVVLTYLDKPFFPQYEVEFSGWELNMEYPEAIFEFNPPPSSRQITWMKTN